MCCSVAYSDASSVNTDVDEEELVVEQNCGWNRELPANIDEVASLGNLSSTTGSLTQSSSVPDLTTYSETHSEINVHSLLG